MNQQILLLIIHITVLMQTCFGWYCCITAEQALLPAPMSHTAELGGSYLSAGHLQPLASTLPPQLSEMEVPGFQYHPLFCDRSRLVVSGRHLLCLGVKRWC